MSIRCVMRGKGVGGGGGRWVNVGKTAVSPPPTNRPEKVLAKGWVGFILDGSGETAVSMMTDCQFVEV